MNLQTSISQQPGPASAAVCTSPSAPTVPRLLILGLGNDILSDDGIGLRVTEMLEAELAGVPGVVVAQSTQVGFGLLDIVCGFSELIVVDSIQTLQAPPGFVHVVSDGEFEASTMVSPHFVGLSEMLALGQKLGMNTPRSVTVLAIEVADPFTVSTSLSPKLSRQFDAISRAILSCVLARMTGWEVIRDSSQNRLTVRAKKS